MKLALATRPSTSFTYQQASEALNRIKAEYEVNGGRLEIIPEERYEEVYKIMADHFLPDEPLCTSYGVKWTPELQNIVYNLLRENLSVMMMSEGTNEVMGVRISGVIKNTDDNSDLLGVTDEPLRNLFVFITQKDSEINFFGRYGLEIAMHFLAIGVRRKYRQMGLGTKLMGACVALSRELGFKAIRGEATSNFSQHIFQKYGFQVLFELPYDQFMVDGKTMREKTGVHNMTKIVGLPL